MGIAKERKSRIHPGPIKRGVLELVFGYSFALCGSASAFYCIKRRTTFLCSGYGGFSSVVALEVPGHGWSGCDVYDCKDMYGRVGYDYFALCYEFTRSALSASIIICIAPN